MTHPNDLVAGDHDHHHDHQTSDSASSCCSLLLGLRQSPAAVRQQAQTCQNSARTQTVKYLTWPDLIFVIHEFFPLYVMFIYVHCKHVYTKYWLLILFLVVVAALMFLHLSEIVLWYHVDKNKSTSYSIFIFIWYSWDIWHLLCSLLLWAEASGHSISFIGWVV